MSNIAVLFHNKFHSLMRDAVTDLCFFSFFSFWYSRVFCNSKVDARCYYST